MSRGTIVSLLFLVCTLHGYSYLDEITSAVSSRTAEHSILFTDSSGFTSTNSYYHVLTLNQGDMSEDGMNLRLNSFTSRNSAAMVFDQWGVGGEVNYHSAFLSMDRSEDSDREELRAKSPIITGALSAWFHSRYNLSLGITVGNSFSSQITGDSTVAISVQAPITTLTAALPLTLRTELRYKGNHIHGGYNYYRGLMVSTAPRYEIINSGSFRTAPLSVMEQVSRLSVGVHNERDSLTLSYGVHRHWGTTFITADNALPVMPELLAYKTTIEGAWNRFFGTFSYWKGSGYFYAYDSDKIKDRFILFDNLIYRRLYANIGFTGKSLSGSLFTENVTGKMTEYGYIDYYPLSSWTIFKPVAFRYSNGALSYRTIGGEIKGTKKWNNRTSSQCVIRSSYLEAHMQADRETKKIAVLIPFYTDDTTISYFDERLILNDVTLEQSFHFQNVKLSIGAKQLIPIRVREKNNQSDPGNGSSSTALHEDKNEAKGFGGLNVFTTISIPF